MDDPSNDERRSLDRVAIRPGKPVYVHGNVDGVDVDLLVENLSVDGATLICPESADSFRAGRRLGGCVLILPDVGQIAVVPIIRWRIWPKVGVQFDGITDDNQTLIARFFQENRSRS